MMILTIAGNIGKDAETKTVGQQGTVITEFSVACRTPKGETEWVRCAMFGVRGERLQQYLTRGSKVTVTGSVTFRVYQKNDGGTGTSIDLNVSDVALQGGGQQGDGQQQSQQPHSQQQSANFDDSDIPF